MRTRIEDWPRNERPREKLLTRGAPALSDLELLAVILGSGSRGVPVMVLARRLLKLIDAGGASPSLESLTNLSGMGTANATRLAAAMEFARRRIHPPGCRIGRPTDILPLFRHYADRKQEYFLCASLNGAGEVLATRVVTVGLVDQSQVHPREVFADPLGDRASAVIVGHNHPSGSVLPSAEDLAVTRRLGEAGRLLGVEVLDHIIFTASRYYSFAEHEPL